jgi:hypothetical protein
MRDIPVKNTFARSQRIMHWLVLLMIVIAYAAMELKGFTTKGSAPRVAGSHPLHGGGKRADINGGACWSETHPS